MAHDCAGMSPLDNAGMIFKNSSVDGADLKRRPKRFRFWMIVIALIVGGGVVAVLVAIAIQNHDDHVLTAQMIQTETDLKTTGARIADVKDRHFTSMADYVNAYSHVAPLLDDYDHKLHEYVDLCNRAQLRDERWLLINIKSLHRRHNSDICRDASGIIELIGQINAVMKKEASVIRDMSSLPEKEQVQFWHEEFAPLLTQEHALRETLLVVGQRTSPESTQ
jgi:hypothetical protein